MICIGGSALILFVYVAIKDGKPDKKSYADKVFHAFDVSVIIYQSENFFDFAHY